MVNHAQATQPQEKSNLKPWLFLICTLGLTWALEFLAAAVQHTAAQGWILVMRYVGGAMPLLVTLVLLRVDHSSAYRRDFWQRLIQTQRIKPFWWAICLLFVPLKSGLAALIDLALGGWGIAPEGISAFLAEPLMILPTLLFWLVFGPLPEEPGWRGYALDGLQGRYSAWFSSLVVGLSWALWHLPLFFIQGTWQAESIGLGSQRFWLYLLSILIESVIYTWIVNNTQRSILAPILYHFATNSFGELFALSPRADVINFVLLIIAVVFVGIVSPRLNYPDS